MQVQAAALLNRYGQRATLFILDKARTFASYNGKKLLIVLNATTDMGRSSRRDDQEILDYLVNQKFDYFDMNAVSLQEYQKAKSSLILCRLRETVSGQWFRSIRWAIIASLMQLKTRL
jgi:hypothetical protein